METEIDALKERFKSLASTDHIWDSPPTSETKVNSSTPYYYMFRASKQVVSSPSVTRSQTVSRAMSTTTGKSVDNLRAWDNGPVDQIGQTRLSLFFDLADVAQYVSGRNSSLRLQIRCSTWCTLCHPMCCTSLCLQQSLQQIGYFVTREI